MDTVKALVKALIRASVKQSEILRYVDTTRSQWLLKLFAGKVIHSYSCLVAKVSLCLKSLLYTSACTSVSLRRRGPLM